jgi:hypothetical protein
MRLTFAFLFSLALLAPGDDLVPPPASPPVAIPDELPQELEGVRLGQPLLELQGRFELGSQPAYREGETARHILDVQQTISSRVRDDLMRRNIRRLALESRQGRVTSIKVEYSDRRETTFAEIEADLTAKFGPALRTQTSGPMQVGRAKGIRLYLWLRTWTWEADDRVFSVEGEHYGDDKYVERPMRHTFRYALEAR